MLVCLCVRMSSGLGKNARTDMDAVWRGRSDGSRYEADFEAGFGDRGQREGVIFGANMGRPIVTKWANLLLLKVPCMTLYAHSHDAHLLRYRYIKGSVQYQTII